jgi:hypothetical protein
MLFVDFCDGYREELEIVEEPSFISILLSEFKLKLKDLQLKHLRVLLETAEDLSARELIHTVIDAFKQPLPGDGQEEALVTDICANIGAKLPGAAYNLDNGVFVDQSEKFLAKTEGMRKFEPVLKRFICRHLLHMVEGSPFVPTHPLDYFIGNDYFPWPEGIEIESGDGIVPLPLQLKHAHTLWQAMNELLNAVNGNQDDGYPGNVSISGAAQGNSSTATNKPNKQKKRGAKAYRFKF